MGTASERKLATAYHEAGHAVVAFYLFLPFRYVTVLPDESTGSLGHLLSGAAPKWACDEHSSRHLKQREYWEKRIMLSFDGRIAEQKHRGSRVRYGYHSDYQHIAEVGLSFGGYSPEIHVHWFRWLHAWTKGIVEMRWLDIEAVANALIKKQTLTRDEVRIVIDERIGLKSKLRLRPPSREKGN